MDNAELGIVIPALDEAETLPHLLRDLAQFDLRQEVLVVDGGSRDDTVHAARGGGAQVMRSRTGRARQMNAGARFLQTPWLLILHADSRLDANALRTVERHVRTGRTDAGCLRLAIAHRHPFYRFIEASQRIRSRHAGLVYGDQGLLVPRDLFSSLGPYPAEPIMEDVILNRRLLGAGRLRTLPATIATSARRYEEEGRLRAWIRNTTLITRFLAGARPEELAHRYPPRRLCVGAGPAKRDNVEEERRAVLLVFARAPRPGQVKTRLARSIGDAAAARVYRRMGRFVVDRLAGVRATVTVCYDPPDAGDEVRAWLGDGPARYVAQPPGDLGRRMAHMFERAFAAAERVVVIGTDAPSVDAGTVNRALGALDSADVVLGPATDGGYYLMGLRAPCPALFEGISWGTDTVVRDTAARVRAAGARLTWIEVESDVDTADDLTPEVMDRLGLGPAVGTGAGPGAGAGRPGV